MEHYTGEQRAFCVEAYYKNGDSCTIARRLFCSNFRLHDLNQCPSESVIRSWVRKFESLGSTLNEKPAGRTRTVRTEENVSEVVASVRRDPQQSSRKRSAELAISRTSLRRILTKDLKLHPYKLQLVQELKPNDHHLRLAFAETMLERFQSLNNILFSDEAHFHLCGFVNKQNCRYWAVENPQLKHQRPLHSLKVTVWAAMSAQGIIGPHFFENERSHTVTVNSDRYTAMLRNFFFPQLHNFEAYNSRTWFQQDGATSHTFNESLAVVNEVFNGKLILRRGDIPWPPRSPDLTPLDFFLWGYLKSRVYANKPTTIAQLKENIREEMSAIPRAMCQKVFTNLRNRLEECKREVGKHLNDVIFKK
ncbi:uncharacterized protein LOC124531912 [Vanessa cardui]|uniref:uncharacterized protein LOC124531912 n=1 Tax=Vanessa cardui TaxID=171605 RepID=UPI001F1472C6|nr:uncharacterized protein LOC124531912 [Vanessa cardui]